MLREAEPFTPFVSAVDEVDDHFGSILEFVAAHLKNRRQYYMLDV